MSRFLNLFRSHKLEADLEDEFRFHIDQLTEKHMLRGLSREDARIAARWEFGSPESAKDRYRDQRGVPYIEDFLNDLRYAARLLLRNPLFASVCILTLGLGIGANAAIFSLVNAALLKLAPFPEAERLVEVCRRLSGQPLGSPYHNTLKYLYLKERLQTFESLAAFKSGGDANLIVNGNAQQVTSQMVSANYFASLGAIPAMGRSFTEEEDRSGGPSVAILSHSLWQRAFSGDRDIVGKTLNLGGHIYTVTGVMHSDFVAIPKAELWVPMRPRPINDGTNTYVFGRLKRNVSKAQANQELDALVQAFGKEFAGSSEMRPGESAGIAAFNSNEGRSAKRALMILLGAVGLVLLIACANLANLLLARATAREREVAIRATLGAGRERLVRQMLAESLLIAALGGILGVSIAYVLLPALVALNPISLSILREVRIDRTVLAFTALLSGATGVLFGLAPALQVARMSLGQSAREGGLKTSAGKSTGRMRQVLVVSEVALSTLLLIGAGLLMRTFWNLLSVHPGVDVSNVIAGQMPLQGDRYDTASETAALYQRGLERIRNLPNVDSAAVILNLPMERGLNLVTWLPSTENPEQPKFTDVRYATPEFFQVMRIPLLLGRLFTEADGPDAARVAVINRRFAHLYFGDAAPLGQAMRFGKSPQNATLTIIGVVGDAKSQNFRVEAQPMVYMPVAQTPDEFVRTAHRWFQPSWVVRSRDAGIGLVEAVQREVKSVDPLQPFSAFRTLEEVRSKALQIDRAMTILLGGFACVALFLAAAGIYGVISYTVAQRTHEIGIRMALGATITRVIRSIVGRGFVLALIGVLVGVAGALALTRFLDTLVFGIQPADPLTFSTGATCLLLLAAIASALPALRITRMDPAKALRTE